MIIVYVRHEQCDQPRGGDFYIAVDGTTAEQFKADVRVAQQAYLDTRAEFEKLTPKPDPWIRWADQYLDPRNGVTDTMTIGEAKALQEKRFAESKAWNDERSRVAGSFQTAMKERGYVRIDDLVTWGDAPEVFVAQADWGHRHGQKLDY